MHLNETHCSQALKRKKRVFPLCIKLMNMHYMHMVMVSFFYNAKTVLNVLALGTDVLLALKSYYDIILGIYMKDCTPYVLFI